MSRAENVLVIGVGGHVVAIDPATGSERWRTRLKSASLVTVCVDGGRVFAGANGQLYCLDGATGQVLWHNALKGLGTGFVTFGSTEASAAASIEATNAAAAAAVVVANS